MHCVADSQQTIWVLTQDHRNLCRDFAAAALRPGKLREPLARLAQRWRCSTFLLEQEIAFPLFAVGAEVVLTKAHGQIEEVITWLPGSLNIATRYMTSTSLRRQRLRSWQRWRLTNGMKALWLSREDPGATR